MEASSDSRFNPDLRTDPTTNIGEQGQRSTINGHMEAHPSTLSNNQAPPSPSSPSQNPFLGDSDNNTGNRGMMNNNGSSSTYIAGDAHSLFPPSTHEPSSPGNPFQEPPKTNHSDASFGAFDAWDNQPFVAYETVTTKAEPQNNSNLGTPFSSFPENAASKSQIDNTLAPLKHEVDPKMAAESSDDDIDIPISSMPNHARSGYVAPTPQHSPSSSLSSAPGSNEEIGTNKGGSEIQNPPVQVMERQEGESGYVFPSHVFARNTTNAPGEWSTASNESLFSIYMGNMSFTSELMCFNNKSTELDKPGDMFMLDPPNASPSPPQQQQQQPPPLSPRASKFNDISQRTAELHEERARETKAAETMREVIMESSNATAKGDGRSYNRQSDRSTQSFAFQLSTDKDKSVTSKGAEDKQKLKKQQEAPKAEVEAPKAATNAPPNKWLSCFSCCPFCK